MQDCQLRKVPRPMLFGLIGEKLVWPGKEDSKPRPLPPEGRVSCLNWMKRDEKRLILRGLVSGLVSKHPAIDPIRITY